jgi:transposase
VLERRRRWFDGQLDLDPLKLVFIDETSATTNMARRYGRRRRGKRLRCGVPHGHYKAITFVCGLRLRGVVASKAYDHAMNAETFEAWLVEHLLPTLDEGDIVVLDNLKAHKNPRVAEILARKGCTVRYLPPYSPNSTRRRIRSLGTSEGEVPLTPRIGHRGLVLLARWLARRDENEATPSAVDGPAERPSAASGRADEPACPTAPLGGTGGSA